MSERDDKGELSERPWDPAGTQPKHDPASLLPESSEPLLARLTICRPMRSKRSMSFFSVSSSSSLGTRPRRSSGSAMQGDPIASVLSDRDKREAAAQILGQAYITALCCVRHNREAVARIAAVAGVVGARRERPRRMALTPV